MTTTEVGRRVRVNVEGEARPLGTSDRWLRVFTDNGMAFVVDTADAAVTVEDAQPVRAWREGDVVQADDLVAFWRGARLWHGVLPAGVSVYMTDDEVSMAGYAVLRYQGGEG